MRFALAAADRHRGVFEAFVGAGWTPVKLYSTPTDERVDFNRALVARAMGLGLPVQLSPIVEEDLADLGRRGCDALVVAGYNWRIGAWHPHLRFAINFHPSPLPVGRGPYPAVRAILDQHATWGVSCHRIEHAFDAGPVLATSRFPLAPDECHESLDLKIQLAVDRLAGEVARDFERAWNDAVPQDPFAASYWKRWSESDRTLDFGRTVAEILRQVRAFGLLETQATINGSVVHVRRAVGWTDAPRAAPGTVVHVGSPRTLVVAAADGYVGLVEWSSIELGAADRIGR
ncbi:MAG TPA: formyltransferase family protein [Burkholderiaceae bacterium]|nr:formyltransferase family protein [Burkholderiaceae bacterium]